MPTAPHPFTLRQLQYAVAVADTLSFRQAAARCAVSQPALSTQLAALERALGFRLFERDQRRVLVTPAGQALLARTRAALVCADELLAAARQLEDPLAGALRLGVIPTLSPYLLPTAAPALRKAFPKLAVTWVEEKTSVLARALAEGAIDAAVAALVPELAGFERAVLADDAFLLATPRGHPLGTKAAPATLAELRDESVLLLDEGHCFREQALAYCARARAHELEFRATSLSTLAQMVAQGAGVTLLPAIAVSTEARRAGLAVRRFAPPVPHRTVALVWRKGAALAEPLKAVARTLAGAWPAGA